MKTVLTTINARYSHSSLAIRYLKAYNSQFDIELAEFSINDRLGDMYAELCERNAQVYCFSCYIWNIEMTLKLAQMVKCALPHVHIVLGGPEAGYNAEKLLLQYDFITCILHGEGEITLGELLKAVQEGKCLKGIPGVVTQNGKFVPRPPMELDTVVFPYTREDIESLKNKLIYFETSRGCPFNCAYCLSAAEHKVRFFPLEYVKQGLLTFFEMEVPLIKLVDRTFNCNAKRAEEIVRFILAHSKKTCVHMEVEPQILTDEFILLLSSAPKGMFQLEIGVQSTNSKTLESVGRGWNAERAERNIRRLVEAGNMHIHLDLIAGLPFEDMQSFRKSFNDVYALRPQMLQLGFLKVLSGTPIEEFKGITAVDFPPYEVIATQWLSYQEILHLKEIEEAVELFYNSGIFARTIAVLTEEKAFEKFEELGALYKEQTRMGKVKRQNWYTILYEKYGDHIWKALVEDFLLHNQNWPMPAFSRPVRPEGFQKRVTALLRNEYFRKVFQIENDPQKIRFEYADGICYMADYNRKMLFDITSVYEAVKLI